MDKHFDCLDSGLQLFHIASDNLSDADALRHMAPVFRVAFLTSVNNRQIPINPMFLVVGVTDKKREAFPEASQAPSMFDNFILYLLRHVCLSTYTGFWESGIASLGIAVQVVQEACSG